LYGVKEGRSGNYLKVLMLGWEFPPFFAGGAGIVCSELSKSLTDIGVEVTFIMPSGPDEIETLTKNSTNGKFKLIIANNRYKGLVKIKKVNSLLTAYTSSSEYSELRNRYMKLGLGKSLMGNIYGINLREEVLRFAQQALLVAEEEDFDVIHAHDWVTFPAAIALKKKTGKPMIVHVHITEFDKTGSHHADPFIYSIEKSGMDNADRVITVSQRVKDMCVAKYGINPDKIVVVHNAAPPMVNSIRYDNTEIKANDKIVLFAGRVTLQKGPDYFVDAAKVVLNYMQNVKFIIAGTGDMLPQIIHKVASMGMSDKFIFSGFYSREDAEKLFSMADVFVMPSVSEPFGVVPYEAQLKGAPTIISKQSGISEVLNHTIKVDFWDVNQLAAKILSIISYPSLKAELRKMGMREATGANWSIPATKCLNIYKEALASKGVIV